MNVILKKHIDNYRYAVGKTSFLKCYNEFDFIKDIPSSNCMIVRENCINATDIIVSIFGQPNPESTTKNRAETVRKYYQAQKYTEAKNKEKYTEAKNKGENIETIYKLKSDFDDICQKDLERAFKNPHEYLSDLEDNHKKIVQEYFFDEDEEKAINDKCYKYYSSEKVENNGNGVKDGKISFVHPKYFNDPFDCNFVLSGNEEMSKLVRVLCLTYKHNDILMWSYYAEDHKGYCFEYETNEIISAIKNINEIDGICIFGEVAYKDKRPEQKLKVETFSYTDIKHYVDAAFTKYKEWEHEKEYRFVIFSNQLKDDAPCPIKIRSFQIYAGCMNRENKIKDIDKKKLVINRLCKDDEIYFLKDTNTQINQKIDKDSK